MSKNASRATSASADEESIDSLASLASSEFYEALGWARRLAPSALFSACMQSKLRGFAKQVIEFDRDVARLTLPLAANRLVSRELPPMLIDGASRIPQRGPTLLVANHPGLFDALAIATVVKRDDLAIVVKEQPYWDLLPNLSRKLFTVPPSRPGRVRVARQVLEHLQQNMSVLLFPGGQIERDHESALSCSFPIEKWSSLPEWLMVQVPNLRIATIAIGGVMSRRVRSHPICNLRMTYRDRDWLAATIQFFMRRHDDVRIKLCVGKARSIADISQEHVRLQLHHDMRLQLRKLKRLAKRSSTIPSSCVAGESALA